MQGNPLNSEPRRDEPKASAARRKLKWPWWATLITGCLAGVLILVGVWSWVFHKMFGSFREDNEEDPPPPATIHIGEQLRWRTLASFQHKSSALSTWQEESLQIGDFTGNGEPDLLVLRATNALFQPQEKLLVIELDGSIHKVALPANSFSFTAVPFDYDHDGIQEIALLTWSKDAQVINMAGRIVGTIHASKSIASGINAADLNGDGYQELPCMELNGSEIIFAGAFGREVWRKSLKQRGHNHCTGDINGDGVFELIDYSEDQPIAYGINNREEPIQAIQSMPMNLYCLDVTADGCDELVDPALGWYNLATGEFTAVNWPVLDSHYGVTAFADFVDVAAVDIDGDQSREVVMTGNPYVGSALDGTGIFTFDSSGNMVYHEEFGEYVHNIAVITDNAGTEHIIAHTQSRILIYP